MIHRRLADGLIDPGFQRMPFKQCAALRALAYVGYFAGSLLSFISNQLARQDIYRFPVLAISVLII